MALVLRALQCPDFFKKFLFVASTIFTWSQCDYRVMFALILVLLLLHVMLHCFLACIICRHFMQSGAEKMKRDCFSVEVERLQCKLRFLNIRKNSMIKT